MVDVKKEMFMADEATQAADEAVTTEQTVADSASETQSQDSNATSTEQSAENENKTEENKDTASSGDKKQSENQDSKQDSKPLSRRSAAYRIQQLTRENKELRQQQKPEAEQTDDWAEDPKADEQPSVAELVSREVERRLNPVINESSKAADDAELSSLFADKPDQRAKYESKIRSMWNLPQYKDVAAADLYKMLDHDSVAGSIEQAKQQAIEEFKKAEREAKESSASGTSNSNRSGKGGKSVADMTPQELEEHNQRVIAGQAT